MSTLLWSALVASAAPLDAVPVDDWSARLQAAHSAFDAQFTAQEVTAAAPDDLGGRQARSELAAVAARRSAVRAELARVVETLDALPLRHATSVRARERAAAELVEIGLAAEDVDGAVAAFHDASARTDEAERVAAQEAVSRTFTRWIVHHDADVATAVEALQLALFAEHLAVTALAERDALDGTRASLEGQLALVEAEWVAATRAVTFEPDLVASAPSPWVAVAGQYAELLLELPAVAGALPEGAWCDLLVRGGVARLRAGLPGSVELLGDAAAAPYDACRPALVGVVHVGDVQAAWSEALFRGSVSGPVTVALDRQGARWWIDEQEVHGVGSTTVVVGPGLHRLRWEATSGAGGAHVEQLGGGRRVVIAPDGDGVSVRDLDDDAPGFAVLVADRSVTPPGSAGLGAHPVIEGPRHVQIGVGARGFRVAGEDFAGVYLSFGSEVRRGAFRAPFGAVWANGWGAERHAVGAIATTGVGLLGAQVGAQLDVGAWSPGLRVEVASLVGVAALAQARGVLEWTLSERASLAAEVGAAVPIWRDGVTSPSIAGQFGFVVRP